jgi:cytochrome c553
MTNREPLVRFVVKHPWFTAAALAGFAGVLATLVVVSGVIPIGASSGHWPITNWLLDFAKVRSVKTHSMRIQPPPLDDSELVVRGAAHYALGCAPCHGGPDAKVPPVMTGMTPPPPELTDEHIERWSTPQLFSIVKHGIKFTGMPGWSVQQRDDEIWAVVAFLTRMPQMNAGGYRELVYGVAGGPPSPTSDLAVAGNLQAPQAVRDLCWRCHGTDGTGRNGVFPILAGQRAAYLHASLRAFADRSRFSGTMTEIAARLDERTMREIAAYYEGLPARVATETIEAAAVSRGAQIATRGIPEREIPACIECHGPTATPKNPAYPILMGQHTRYLMLQLDLLKQRRRGGSPRVNLMYEVATRLNEDEMREVARFYAFSNAAAP